MLSIQWKKFLHPAGVYRLEYPAYWDQVQQDEARPVDSAPMTATMSGCGFP